MAFDFPASPTVGQVYQHYVWDGIAWQAPGTATVIAAAPFDALAYNGMQLNGSMDVSQELGATGRSTPGYVCDGWYFNRAGTMVLGSAQSATALTPGLPCCIYINVGTAQASIGAGDYVFFIHHIEGYRVARLGWGTANAQPITIGFWTSHNRTGVYSGSIRNASNTRSYAFSYTQNASNVPQYNAITIPGCTDGTWDITNGKGLSLSFAMAMGATAIAPAANVWSVGSYAAAPGQINGVAATSDIFRITGVVVLPGIAAPAAAQSPLIMRPYDQELVLCRRYLLRRNFIANNFVTVLQSFTVNQANGHLMVFPQELRDTPVLTNSGPATFNVQSPAGGGGALNNLVIVANRTEAYVQLASTGANNLAIGNATSLYATAAAFIQFDARL